MMANRCHFVLSAIKVEQCYARATWLEHRRGVMESPGRVLRTTLTRSGGKLTGLHSLRNGATPGPPICDSRRFKSAPTQGHYHLMLGATAR